MPALQTPVCNFALPAVDFSLPSVDGATPRSLADCTGLNGLLVMFICNHCPFVQSILDDLVADCQTMQKAGIGVVAISANDVETYAEDSPEKMAELARDKQFGFPYLYDEDQQVAKAYNAVCTPDFFGYNSDLQLQYRGRFDDRGRNANSSADRELRDAMLQIAKTGKGPEEQTPSIGCSIKWKR